MRIGAQLHIPPSHVLCALCSFTLGQCSIRMKVCALLAFQKTPPSLYPPVAVLVANKCRPFHEPWVKCARGYKVSFGLWIHKEGLSCAAHQPSLQTFSQFLSVGRGWPAGPKRFTSVSTHKMSIHGPCPCNFATPPLPLPLLPSSAAEAIQLGPKAGTFNLTECSRHLNYLTAVFVQEGGHRG